MAIGLREIPPLGSIDGCVFAVDAEVVRKFQQLVEIADGVVDAPDAGKRIYVPERADQEGTLGKTKIVVVFIPVEEPLFQSIVLFPGR